MDKKIASKLSGALACPICKKAIEYNVGIIICDGCGRKFVQNNDKFINLFPEEKLAQHNFKNWQFRQNHFIKWVDKVWNEEIAVKSKDVYNDFSNFIGDIRGLTLDIGCSDGHLNNYFRKATYVGIDPYEGWVLNERPIYMEKIYPIDKSNLIFIKGLGEYLPFRDKIFNNIIISNALDHSNFPHIMLSEAMRALKDGGSIYLMHEDPILITKIMRMGIRNIYFKIRNLCIRLIRLGNIESGHTSIRPQDLKNFLSLECNLMCSYSRDHSHVFIGATRK